MVGLAAGRGAEVGSLGRIPESPPIFTRNRCAACVLSVDWSWIDSLGAPWRFTVLSGWGVRQGGIHGSFLPANVVPHAFVSFNSWEGAPMRLGFAPFQALTLGVPFFIRSHFSRAYRMLPACQDFIGTMKPFPSLRCTSAT